MNATFLWAEYEPIISEANKWNLVRMYRGGLLARCDWTQLADAPLTLEEKQVWSDYRQTLRDLPQNFDAPGPDAVIFPAVPGAE